MDYEEFVEDSIAFFEDAKKRSTQRLQEEENTGAVQQLEKEIQTFSDFIGYWKQEKSRIILMRKYSQKYDK